MTYLPAPYEAARGDDLPAALAAGLAGTVAGITAWITASWAYPVARDLIDGFAGRLTAEQEQAIEDALPYTVIPAAGWAVSAILLALGAVLLCFHRGRGVLLLGALLSVATTAYAQFGLDFGTEARPVEQWPLYWGGAVVLVLAVLPATSRWVGRRPAGPPVLGAATLAAGTGAITAPTLWSGL